MHFIGERNYFIFILYFYLLYHVSFTFEVLIRVVRMFSDGLFAYHKITLMWHKQGHKWVHNDNSLINIGFPLLIHQAIVSCYLHLDYWLSIIIHKCQYYDSITFFIIHHSNASRCNTWLNSETLKFETLSTHNNHWRLESITYLLLVGAFIWFICIFPIKVQYEWLIKKNSSIYSSLRIKWNGIQKKNQCMHD